jgi:hypothetical protein
MDDKIRVEKLQKFCCNICDFITSEKWRYVRHISTGKHKKETKEDILDDAKSCTSYLCKCGKEYKYRQGLWKHQKKCETYIIENNINSENTKSISINSIDKEHLINYLLKENSEFKQLLLDQNKQIFELAKIGSNYNINNTNSHNKTFNLNMFLNETCKNAMNITDFVDSLQLQISDLENIGDVGYIEGISNIIIKKLNTLDVTERPIHCTDKKRETMYIKDENKWEKEDENKEKLHKLVKKVSNKNINLISEFQKLHPEYKKCSSRVSDQYNKIVIESMGGKGDNHYEKEEKIIKKIAKEVFVDKDN